MPEFSNVVPYPMQGGRAGHQPPLKTGDGGGIYEDMSIVDAKIAAAEARTDTKFAELMGELKAIEKSTAGIKTTVVVTGIAAVALVVAIFGWGSSMFGVGMNAQTISDQAAQNVLVKAQPKFEAIQTQFNEMAARYDKLDGQLADILKAVRSDRQEPQGTSPAPFKSPG